jgi:hypothetical protein
MVYDFINFPYTITSYILNEIKKHLFLGSPMIHVLEPIQELEPVLQGNISLVYKHVKFA